MYRIAGAVVAVLFLATIASAQVPSGNIFFGYSYAKAEIGGGDRTNLNGWNGSLEGKVFPWVGIVADVSGHYGNENVLGFSTDGTVYTAVFGPRVSVQIDRLRPFGHVMLGVSRLRLESSAFSDSDTTFATTVGGGFDYNLVPAIAWRVQADAVHTSFFSDSQNNFRLSTGIVFRF